MVSRNERGTALVSALLFAIVVLGLVTTIISSGLSVKQQTRYMLARQGAQQAAESGVHLTLAKLAGPNATAVLDAGAVEGILRGTGERAPRYNVTIVPAGADGADNDLDGVIDEADEDDMVEVTSTGRFDGVMRTVRVTLLARYRQAEYPSAAYIADPLADVTFNGNSFLVSGIDVDLDGNPTGALVPGIGVNGSAIDMIGQLGNNQDDNVVGAGGTPSVATVPELDLQDLVEEGARSANVTLEGQSVYHPANAGDWGTIDHPAILYAPGSVKISGGASGAGMLIVNGNLEITGAFTWEGLIIVKGAVEFKGRRRRQAAHRRARHRQRPLRKSQREPRSRGPDRHHQRHDRHHLLTADAQPRLSGLSKLQHPELARGAEPRLRGGLLT